MKRASHFTARRLLKLSLTVDSLRTAGKTPEATMNIQLVVDTNSKKQIAIYQNCSICIWLKYKADRQIILPRLFKFEKTL